MEDFLNSNLFQTIVTFLVGLVAFAVYWKQKQDYKKGAANEILLEVQNAERVINRIKESLRREQLEVDYKIIPSDSWGKYQHLFVRDFDRDEWDAITDFYTKSILLDNAVKYNGLSFANDVEQIRINRQRILADVASEIINEATTTQEVNPEELLTKFNNKVKVFDNLYMSKQGEYAYAPQKPILDAKVYIQDLKNVSTTTIGMKLKRLSK